MATDFSKGKRGPVEQPDPNNAGGGNYQTLINNVLRDHIEATDETLEKTLRKIVREELKKAG